MSVAIIYYPFLKNVLVQESIVERLCQANAASRGPNFFELADSSISDVHLISVLMTLDF